MSEILHCWFSGSPKNSTKQWYIKSEPNAWLVQDASNSSLFFSCSLGFYGELTFAFQSQSCQQLAVFSTCFSIWLHHALHLKFKKWSCYSKQFCSNSWFVSDIYMTVLMNVHTVLTACITVFSELMLIRQFFFFFSSLFLKAHSHGGDTLWLPAMCVLVEFTQLLLEVLQSLSITWESQKTLTWN